MKKTILALALCVTGVSMSAQSSDPNRMLVISNGGSYHSTMIERIDAIEFHKVDGRVATDVQVGDATLSSVKVNTMMTEDCTSYMINCFPAVIARQLMANPASMFAYMKQMNSPVYSDNFTSGELSGLEDVKPNTDYAIVTASYDKYNTECEVVMGVYTTPSLPLKGDPKVDLAVTDAGRYSISVRMTPTSDVGGYSYVIGEKGELARQFEQFAPMFGFSNMTDMVKTWGGYTAHDEVTENTWKDLEPNKEYEIYVQCWDVDEVAAPMQIFNVNTARKGGNGEAYVDVKVVKYELADWNDEMLPSLYVSYTPNDQAGAYRMNVQYADKYDAEPEAYDAALCSDPEMPMVGWFQYEPITTDYQINPDTEIVICVAAKNANGEWGKINKLRYTTPSQVGTVKNVAMPGHAKILTRTLNKGFKGKATVPRRFSKVELR